MKTLGIKLADGSFYPVMEEGVAQHKQLVLTTANNNQTKVMVDLYRSANCTMDDAEYVDSLQIDNLVEHPNGEVSIEFDVSLDENNQLTAHLIDEETGRRSDTELPLITRTLEERELTDEYAIKESEKTENPKNNAKIAGAAGVGLLAMANAINQKNKTESEQAENQSQENVENDDINNDIIEEPTSISDDETSVDETQIDDEPTVEEEFAFDDGEPISSDENQSDEANIFDDEKTSTTENYFADDENLSFDENNENLFDDEITKNDETEQNFQNSDNFNEDDIFADLDLDNLSENDTKSSDETQQNDTNDDIFKDMNLDDISESQNSDFNSTSDDDFDISDFDETESEGKNLFENDDISDGENNAAGGISFTGLYDKETEEGKSEPTDDAEETRKKTKVPVIICIVCAIICIIATILVLFVIPSRINVLKKLANNQNQNVVVEKSIEKPVENPPEKTEPEPIIEQKSEPEPVPQAKEDEIVVVEKAEEVIPEPPEPAPQKAENIVYKIKWGDTLWDIADTYYKNPWKYKYIARWNGIKNPDYIISGTQIIIPAE